MTYLSLYRRQRPLTFSNMTGQEHVARTLSRALVRDRLSHAYLFCGPRGTGKTTAAKILARAANCHRFPTPEPCGQCPSCENIAAGVAMDVIEMDAASNRGIEEIRELRERTRYASGDSRYKVYIIDEAHMLTNEACNAFLKTLEEPPPRVIFILATTDPSRLPATVVSRCQRFDFHLLSATQITQRLLTVVEQEGWQAEEEALRLMARFSEGSMRDALGLLEQCQAYGDEVVTAEHVRTVTGATRTETIGELVEAIASENLEAGLKVLHQVTYSGRDLSLFLRDLIYYFSRLLLGSAVLDDRFEDDSYGFKDLYKRFYNSFSREALLETVELLHQAGVELRQAHHPQFVLEVALIRLFRVLHHRNTAGLAVDNLRVSREEKVTAPSSDNERLAEKIVSGIKAEGEGEVDPNSTPAQVTKEPAIDTITDKPGPTEMNAGKDLEVLWPVFLNEVKKKQISTHDYLKMALKRELMGELFILTYPKGLFAAERIGEKNHRHLVESTLSRLTGKQISIKIIIDKPPEESLPLISPGLEEKVVEPKIQEANEPPPESGCAVESINSTERDDDTLVFDEALKMFNGKIIEVKEKEDDYQS